MCISVLSPARRRLGMVDFLQFWFMSFLFMGLMVRSLLPSSVSDAEAVAYRDGFFFYNHPRARDYSSTR